MTCVAVATSPVLAGCQSPSMRHRDDPGIFGDVRPSMNCLDLLPSSPLLYAAPKLYPFLSSRKSSPSQSSSPMPPPPSPRVQCSPRTPSSWTPPVGTPSARSVCGCGAISVYTSCSCNVASASSSPSDIKWRPTSLEKRFNLEAQSDVKYGLYSGAPNVESPSPRVSGSSPISRFSRSMPPPLLPPEAPSPRFGGSLSVLTSPIVFSSRPSSANPNPHHLTVLVDECEPQSLEGNRSSSTGGPSIPVTRSSTAEELIKLQLEIRSDRTGVVGTAETEPLPVSSSVSTEVVAPADIPSLSGRPISPPLKRKRPPKLEIPIGGPTIVLPSAFPHVVDIAEEAVNEMTVDGSYYGISCKKGRREILEDTHRAVPDLHGDPAQAFFGVFDGHGGRKAADFTAENLVDKITEAIESSPEGEGSLEAAVRLGYLATDAAFLEQQVSSGASCVTALMKDGHMVIANAGDCRAVLSRAGQAEALTSDHRAGRKDERERIESLGGFVDNITSTWRVQGTLAVSRGIGDLHLKEWISAEPEVQKLQITPDCEFLILASDGLWDTVTNQEAVDTARALLQPEHKEAEVVDLQIALAMGTSSLSKEGEELVVAKGDQSEKVQNMDQKNLEEGSETQETKVRVLSTTDDDEVDICMGTMDADMPIVGFPEPPLPSASPAAACKKLVEMSAKRGSHDDVSVLIVDLRHFQRNTALVSRSP